MLLTVRDLSGSLHSDTSAPHSTEDINNYTKSYLVGLPRKKRGGTKDKLKRTQKYSLTRILASNQTVPHDLCRLFTFKYNNTFSC